MKSTSYQFRINVAAQSPLPERYELKTVSLRIGQPFYETLTSIAKVLGKSSSGLAGELLEAMIVRFDDELPELRPDLIETDMQPDLIDGEVVYPYSCKWKRIDDHDFLPDPASDEADENARRDAAQGLAQQEANKKGKGRI